jgi:agmatinase
MKEAGSRSSRRSSSVGSPLGDLPFTHPDTFLGLSERDSAFEPAGVVILPVPYEGTVSYGQGTSRGPRAILEASRYVELYDHELDREPHEIGIHTLPALELPKSSPSAALAEIRRAYDQVLASDKFPIVLGGEHAVSGPLIESWVDRLGEGRLTVLQLDAHADLREEWEGTPLSHACVMYRVHRRVQLVQVGIRAITSEERALMRRADVTVVFGHELDTAGAWITRAFEAMGSDVYISIDVDYFDPSLVPSTGTPEPGGGQWYPTLELLRRVFNERRVHAVDVVEHAPIAGLHAPDFLVAKLVYKLVGFHSLATQSREAK